MCDACALLVVVAVVVRVVVVVVLVAVQKHVRDQKKHINLDHSLE